jgi:hypothetical protein
MAEFRHQIRDGSGYLVVYSCSEQVMSGVGNVSADPCLVSGAEADYYLSQVAAGQAVDSPCANAGSDLAANLGMDIYIIRSDNRPEFIADAINNWLRESQVGTLYIEPGSPWEKGYIESFNGRFRDEVLNRELFHSVKEAKVIAEDWRLEYNNHRPHSGLDYMTSAAFAASCNPPGPATLRLPDCMTKNVDNFLIRVGT